jgi:hypothetical protein
MIDIVGYNSVSVPTNIEERKWKNSGEEKNEEIEKVNKFCFLLFVHVSEPLVGLSKTNTNKPS